MIQEQKLARFKVKFDVCYTLRKLRAMSSRYHAFAQCGSNVLQRWASDRALSPSLSCSQHRLRLANMVGIMWVLSLPAVTVSSTWPQSLYEQWLVATRKKWRPFMCPELDVSELSAYIMQYFVLFQQHWFRHLSAYRSRLHQRSPPLQMLLFL